MTILSLNFDISYMVCVIAAYIYFLTVLQVIECSCDNDTAKKATCLWKKEATFLLDVASFCCIMNNRRSMYIIDYYIRQMYN